MNWEKPGKQGSVLFVMELQIPKCSGIADQIIYELGDVIVCRHEWEAALADPVAY